LNDQKQRRIFMPKGYKHLTLKERCQIFKLKATGVSQANIAKILGFSESAISRELNRNSKEDDYCPFLASYQTKIRRAVASRKSRKMTSKLIARIEESLMKQWSPEQISGHLKTQNIFISHERIYQYVWKNKRLGGFLYKNLRRSGKKYNKRSAGKNGRGCIPDRVDIKERPEIVEAKSRIGDWEGDLVIGKNHKGAVLTYVDRASKFSVFEKLDSKSADSVTTATTQSLSEFREKCLTITYDNGKEFSSHKKISKKLGVKCYFATPYHSWERGLNEHTNGLLRQYFPKKTDFSKITQKEIKKVQDLLNNRPRKVLGYRTPKEVFMEAG